MIIIDKRYYRLLIILIGITVALLSVNSTFCWAQNHKEKEPKTLFGDNKVTGFGAFDFKYSKILESDAIIIGGHGGVLFDQHVSLGLGGYTSITSIPFEGSDPEATLRTEFGYTGILIGYNIAPKKLIHLHVPVLFGVGYIDIVQNSSDAPNFNPSIPSEIFVENTTVLVIEPMANLEVNITKFLRLCFGASYRVVNSVNLTNPIENDDFSGWSINTSIVFGKFY